jgi:G3E family GTPase
LSGNRKIPVLIVTGFLGAGKTTFINYLIQNNRNHRFALIENEFGKIALDSTIIQGLAGNYVFELSNGCICCSIFNEFSLTLQDLASRAPDIDYLLIETTGVADPAPLIEPFFRDQDLRRIFELAGTICIADAQNFTNQISGFEQQKQLILSDLVILNKISENSREEADSTIKTIGAMNPTATVKTCDFAQIESPNLIDLKLEITETSEKKLKRPLYIPAIKIPYQSVSIRFWGEVDPERFTNWFRYFSSVNSSKIYRIKGLVALSGSPARMLVQSVGSAVSIEEGPLKNPFDPDENVLVFIGKNLDQVAIQKELKLLLRE